MIVVNLLLSCQEGAREALPTPHITSSRPLLWHISGQTI